MAESTLWWLGTGIAVAVELVTGTFYLLMIAIGLAAGALAAHLGAGATTQIVVAAVVGGGAVAGWHLRQLRRPPAPAAASNPDVNLDVGEIVHIDHWQADGTATVKYRGANWTVVHRSGNAPSTGAHRVAEVVGSRLLVDKIQ
jgi:membrane protein implicated in regulation of membrane protease activity